MFLETETYSHYPLLQKLAASNDGVENKGGWSRRLAAPQTLGALARAGYVERRDGRWHITARGRSALVAKGLL